MKIAGYILLVLSGGAMVLALSVIQKTVDASIGTYVGAFAIPALMAWWGVKLLNSSSKGGDE